MEYEESSKTLFSADAFGKFCSIDTLEEWDCEARRYYFNIVGKYGIIYFAIVLSIELKEGFYMENKDSNRGVAQSVININW